MFCTDDPPQVPAAPPHARHCTHWQVVSIQRMGACPRSIWLWIPWWCIRSLNVCCCAPQGLPCGIASHVLESGAARSNIQNQGMALRKTFNIHRIGHAHGPSNDGNPVPLAFPNLAPIAVLQGAGKFRGEIIHMRNFVSQIDPETYHTNSGGLRKISHASCRCPKLIFDAFGPSESVGQGSFMPCTSTH